MGTTDIQAAVATPATAPPIGSGDGKTAAPGHGTFALFGDDGFTFGDFLDIVNPLQHIPVVSAIYRHLTGDTIDPGSRLAGGALFGGAIGIAVAGFNAAIEDATGKDVGENMIAMFTGDGGEAPGTAVAKAETGAAADPDDAAATPPVPDLALLGPLPPQPTTTIATSSPPAAAPPETPSEAPPVVDLAALGPLPSMTGQPTPGVAAILAAAEPPAAADTVTPAPKRAESAEEEMAERLAKAPADRAEGGPTPPGALAPEGGWFTQTMLSALDKYQKAALLGEIGPQTAAAPAASRGLGDGDPAR